MLDIETLQKLNSLRDTNEEIEKRRISDNNEINKRYKKYKHNLKKKYNNSILNKEFTLEEFEILEMFANYDNSL